MTKNIVKSLTPSIEAGGHRGRGCLFHGSFFNVICLLCKHYNLFLSYFMFKSRYLEITDALNKSGRDKLARLLKTEGLGGTEVVTISEAKIKEAAAGRIGESLGIPRP